MNRVIVSCIVFLAMFGAEQSVALDLEQPAVRQFINDVSRRDGFSVQQLRTLLKDAQVKQAIIDAANRPAEHVLAWYEYRELFLNESRILKGVDFREAHGDALALAADGVPSFVLLGILGAETRFGNITGKFRVLDALATRAFVLTDRADFFKNELEQFLLLAREESLDPQSVKGSYSGAMGAAQFMPSSYRKFAVDADNDGHRDLWNSWADVLGSITNFLKNHGWHTGEPIVARATLASDDLSKFDTSKLALNETIGSLRAKGVKFQTDLDEASPAMLLVMQDKDGPEYLVGFNNFYVLTRYNRSTLYARAVHDLGQAIESSARAAAR